LKITFKRPTLLEEKNQKKNKNAGGGIGFFFENRFGDVFFVGNTRGFGKECLFGQKHGFVNQIIEFPSSEVHDVLEHVCLDLGGIYLTHGF